MFIVLCTMVAVKNISIEDRYHVCDNHYTSMDKRSSSPIRILHVSNMRIYHILIYMYMWANLICLTMLVQAIGLDIDLDHWSRYQFGQSVWTSVWENGLHIGLDIRDIQFNSLFPAI